MKARKFLSLLVVIAMIFGILCVPVVAESTNVAKIGSTEYATLHEALSAAVASGVDTTVSILDNIDLTGIDWKSVSVSTPAGLINVEGNNKTIRGLNNMLFSGTWAGKTGLIINNLTIADSSIVNDKDDTNGNVGVGAFIGYPQASSTITLNNCHLINSTVEGGHWTGGLIGIAGGYNGNDGPVFMNLTIKNCSVKNSTVIGKGSVGGLIGHASCAAWTKVIVEDSEVSGNTLTSTGSSTNKAGAVFGTVGAAGQATTAAGETKTGGQYVAATVNSNTVTSNGTTITTIYGRQGTETGILEVTGGSYDSNPISENDTWAAPSEGYYLVADENGVYGVAEMPKGTVTPAYTKEENGYVRVWGEGGGNATESLKFELYSDDTKIATTQLNNVGGIIDGDVYVTWNFFYPNSNDEYWTTIWEEGHPNSAAQPTKVVLYVDGVAVAENVVKMNAPDDVAPVVWAELGGVEKAWDGLTISNLKELKKFRDAVNAGNNYSGKTVILAEDIDLNYEEWTPIGTSSTPFNGIFDGGNHTIRNLLITGNKSDVGLFGWTNSGEIKNLTVNNANVSGYLDVGVIAGTPYTSKYSNIKVTGHVEVNGFSYVGGVLGKNAYANLTDITVDVDETSYVNANSVNAAGTAYRTYVGGVVGFMGEGSHKVTNVTSNIDVIGSTCDVGGIAGIAHYDNSFINCSSSGDVTITDTGDYAVAQEIGGIAGVWMNSGTVTFEDCTYTGALSSTYTDESGNKVTLTNTDFANGGLIGKGYNSETKGEMVIDYEAYIGTTLYETIEEAFTAVKEGETITLFKDVTLDTVVTLDKDITIDGDFTIITSDNAMLILTGERTVKISGIDIVYADADAVINNSTIGGTLFANGNITFTGINSVVGFNPGWYNHVITIGEGASLDVTGTGRMTVGYGNKFVIKGNITDLKTTDITNLKPSLNIPAGVSITGGSGASFMVENAYIKLYSTTSKNSVANGTFDFDIINSIVDFTHNFCLYSPTVEGLNPVFEFNLKDSVMNVATNLVFYDENCNTTIDNSKIVVGSAMRNGGKLDIVNGSDVYIKAMIQYTSGNAGNNGIITVDNSNLLIDCTTSGHAIDGNGTGSIIVRNNAVADIDYITNTAVTIDGASRLTAKQIIGTSSITIDTSKLTNGTILDLSENASREGNVTIGEIPDNAQVVYGNDGDVALEVAVAEVNGTKYTDFITALKAITSSSTFNLLSDVTITEPWDCRNTGAKIKVPFTFNGNGNTVKFTNTVYDAGNNFCAFRVEADATFKNLTIDMSEALSGFNNRFRAISSKADLTVDSCTFIGNPVYTNTRAIIFGEGAGAAIADVDVSITNSTFTNWTKGVCDNENAQDAKTVIITGNSFKNANVALSAYKSIEFKNNTMDSSWAGITAYTAENELSVVATDNTLAQNGTNSKQMNYISNAKTIDAQEGFMLPAVKIGSKTYFDLQSAFTAAADGDVIALIDDVKISSSISNKKTVTLDLNGYTITGTDTTEKNFGLIANRGKLTIKDSVGTGAITVTATVNSGWNRYSAVISNEVGGELTVESGLIEHLGGTDMAYGIDALTNGNGGTVTTTINGGTVKSTYRAIRQFLNSTTDMNTLVINGGTVVGDNKAVFVHSPSAKSNVGAITVEDTATLTGGVYLFATAGATEYLVDVSIAVEAVGEGTVTTKNFPENYSLKTVDGNYIVKEGNYVAEVNGEKYETLAQAISAAVSGDIVTITKEGAYKLPSFRKDITIKAVDNVTIDNGGAVALHGANVTFENIIFDYYPNVNYTGLQHIATAQYNNCTFNGQVFLYGSSEIFNNCTFNQNSPDAYNVWTYGAATVEFNSCTFNSAGKCVLVYNEGACATSFTAEECTFNASQAVEGKSAVEIDTTLMPDGTEIIINNSTAAGFAPGSVSGNTLWNDKKNQTDLTIKVNDIKVWPAVVKIAEADGSYTYYETLQEAVAAIDSNDDKIYLINDIEVDEVIRLEGKFKVQIYGEGHTVTGSAKKVFEVYTPSATFNNITIVNTAYQGRCIDTRVDNTYVTVRESELKVTNKNTQPITIGGSNTNDNKMVHLNVYNSTITADNGGYAIIVFQPADIAITASNVTGYSALYMKDGSAGSIVNIGGKSVLTGNNEANSYTNAFGTVVFETEGITMNVNQYPTLIANNTGDQSQSIFELKGNANTITMNGKVELNGKNTFILSNLVYDEQTPVTVSDSLVELVEAEGYIVEGNIVKGVNMLSFVDESVMIRNLKKRSVLVLSSYTENGKLIDVKLVDITSDGYTAMSDTGLNTNAHVIKAALWDSVANMTPLCPAIIK